MIEGWGVIIRVRGLLQDWFFVMPEMLDVTVHSNYLPKVPVTRIVYICGPKEIPTLVLSGLA